MRNDQFTLETKNYGPDGKWVRISSFDGAFSLDLEDAIKLHDALGKCIEALQDDDQ